jgi:hypothetical protein
VEDDSPAVEEDFPVAEVDSQEDHREEDRQHLFLSLQHQ